jgi:hypothetical protein
MTPSSYGPFDVELSGLQRDQLRKLVEMAIARGIGASFWADWLTIIAKLKDSPRDWGIHSIL